MNRLRFPKKHRLTKNKDFKSVLDKKVRTNDDLLTVFAAPNGLGFSRLGVSVGKVQAGAVFRNRFKRLVRESFRKNQEKIASGIDYVVMLSSRPENPEDKKLLKQSVKKMGFEQVEQSFLKLAEKAASGLR